MNDSVNHPKHYTSHPSGIEAIEICEHYGFVIGNAIKYLWRAGLKGDAIEDLRKAAWYINREIERRTKEAGKASESAARPAGFIPPPDGYKRLIEFLPRGTVSGAANPRSEMYDHE